MYKRQDFNKRQNQIAYRQVNQTELVGKTGFDTMVAGDNDDGKAINIMEAVAVTTKVYIT